MGASIFHATGKIQDFLMANKADLEDQFDSDRQDFKNTADTRESVEARISRKWDDGIEFEARYYISVIHPGKG